MTRITLLTGLLLANQVAFNAWVLLALDGDVSRVSTPFPPGWFRLAADTTPVRSVAALVPEAAAWLLSPSFLVVNALLELPFALLLYLSAVWLVDRSAVRILVRSPLLPLAVASWTATLCVLSLELPNPRTVADLSCRVVSAAAVLLVLPRLERGGGAGPPPRPPAGKTAGELVLLGYSLSLLSGIALVIGYVALAYNLADFAWLGWLFWPALAGLVLAWRLTARLDTVASPRIPSRVLTSATVLLVGAFFAPALPVRYRLDGSGGLCLAALVAWALGLSVVREWRRATDRARPRLVIGLVLAATAGLVVSASDCFGLLDGFWLAWPDTLVAQRAALFAAAAVLAWWSFDRVGGESPPTSASARSTEDG